MKIKNNMLYIFFVIVLLILFALYLKIPSRIFAEFLDTHQHFLPCDKLPKIETVQEVLKQHQREIQEIENMYGNCVRIDFGDGGKGCTKNADIEITYCNHNQRRELEKRFGKTFYGIPYRGYNY